MAHIFGIRHLSPASSLHLCAYLEQKHPAYILIEGPSDCNDMIEDITQDQLQPPFALWHIQQALRFILFYIHMRNIPLNTSP